MAFAAGNLLGPLTIGRLFDTVGRRKMISGTYLLSGVLLIITAQLFKAGTLNATTQTLCWTVVFFFASAGASAGYLTVSEVFPLEVRAKAMAVSFAIAQGFGSLGSHLYGHLIGNGHDPDSLYWGYLLGAGAMILGGLIAVFFAVDAEGKSLEEVARPLGVVADQSEAIFRAGARDDEVITPNVPKANREHRSLVRRRPSLNEQVGAFLGAAAEGQCPTRSGHIPVSCPYPACTFPHRTASPMPGGTNMNKTALIPGNCRQTEVRHD